MAVFPDARLIEALKIVDAHGDVAPPHVHDPMIALLRQRAVLNNLMRWDDSRSRYVLTGTGRSQITVRTQQTATVLRFKARERTERTSDRRK